MPSTYTRPDCSKVPSFGVAGTNKREFCAGHAEEEMVSLRNRKKCAHSSCSKWPSFGVAGTKKMEFCAGHAKEGMVDLFHKKCAHPGCTKVTCQGGDDRSQAHQQSQREVHPPRLQQVAVVRRSGAEKKVFCAGHAKGGMIDLKNTKKCAHSGCSKYPSFGVAGTKTIEFCTGHAKDGMVNVRYAATGANGDKGGATGGVPSAAAQVGGGGGGSSSSGHPAAVAVSPRAQPMSEGSTAVRGTSACPGGRYTSAAVKDEEVMLSSSVVAGDGSVVMGGPSSRGSKRKGRASPSKYQANADDADAGSSGMRSSGGGSGGCSSTRKRGKRARQSVDDDVVVLEPEQQSAAVAAGGGSRTRRGGKLGPGARVAVKPEQ